MNVKQKAHQLIKSLPDNLTWESLVYAFEVRSDIEAAILEAEQGKFYSTAEIEKEFGLKTR